MKPDALLARFEDLSGWNCCGVLQADNFFAIGLNTPGWNGQHARLREAAESACASLGAPDAFKMILTTTGGRNYGLAARYPNVAPIFSLVRPRRDCVAFVPQFARQPLLVFIDQAHLANKEDLLAFFDAVSFRKAPCLFFFMNDHHQAPISNPSYAEDELAGDFAVFGNLFLSRFESIALSALAIHQNANKPMQRI